MAPSLCAQQSDAPGQVFSNIGGLLFASNFNEWSIPEGTTPTNSQIQWTNNKMCQPTSGGTTFQAFQVGSPITIVDANTANSEVVTVTNFNSNTYGCQIQAVMTHTHYSYRIQSATQGLQEAINAANSLPYQVVVTPDWQRMGGVTSQIINAKGNFNVTILDQRSSVIVPYIWNGSIYVATPFGSGAACGTAGDIQASGPSGFTCDALVTLNTTTHNITTPLINGFTWPTNNPLATGQCITSTTGLVGSFGDCSPNVNRGYLSTLNANMGSTDTTFQLSSTSQNGFGEGYLFLDSEWIKYSSISGQTVNVYPGGRGWFGTAAVGHSSGAAINGCPVALGPSTQLPFFAVCGDPGAGTEVAAVNSGYPYAYNAQVGFNINSGNNAFLVDIAGAVHQVNTGSSARIVRPYFTGIGGNEYAAPIFIGTNSTAPIVDSSYVVQMNIASNTSAKQSFSAGLAGPLTTVQAPTVAAPFVQQQFAPGSTTWSYVCQGLDSDSNLIPGATGSTTGAASYSFPQSNNIFCPPSPGVVSFKVYRTAGGPNVGLVGTATPPYGFIVDFGASLDGTSPSGSNGDIPRLCNNNGQFCILSGTSGTPPLSCTSAQQGWEYHITAATTTPFVLHCVNGSSWTTAY